MKRTKAILEMQERLIRRRAALHQSLNLNRELMETVSGVGDVIDVAIDSEQRELTSKLADAENRELASIASAKQNSAAAKSFYRKVGS